MEKLYVIEARNPDGSLDFASPQPEEIFGRSAIHGITEDQMAQIVWRHAPDAMLSGTDLPYWVRHVDKRFTARVKYW